MITRRRFLGMTAIASGNAAGILPARAAAEPPPETGRLRLVWTGSTCQAPQYVAEELLRAEGFTTVEFVNLGLGAGTAIAQGLAAGRADLTMNFVGPMLVEIDAGAPLVLLAGGHVGCFELVATGGVRAIRDLAGRTVAVNELGSSYIFLDAMAAYVGLDPRKDMKVVVHPPAEAVGLLAEGKVDAYVAFPPTVQELRARKIGHVVVNTTTDRPWSGYFCCLLGGNREFVRRHPAATKRAMRAILKAADLCASEPERAARLLVDKGYAKQYEYALQLMRDIPYGKWREFDPADTIRFYGLRLHETRTIKSHPNKLIAQATDWRFLRELKKELKG